MLLSIAALHAQAAYLFLRRDLRSPWWRLAIVYVPLMLTAERSLWEPGGINRFLLPMTVGFNLLLARSSAPFWPWFVAGNLTLYPALERLARSGFVL